MSNTLHGIIKNRMSHYLCMLGILILGTTTTQAQKLMFGWVKQIAGVGGNASCGDVYKNRTITTDADGYVYNTGNMSSGSTIDFEEGNNPINLDITNGRQFIAKFSPEGQTVWAKQLGSGRVNNKLTSIQLDKDKNIYLGGYFADTFDVDPGPGTRLITSPGTTTQNDLIIIKLDSNANYVWHKQISNVGSKNLYGMKVDADGTVYATGRIAGTVDFDPNGSTGTSMITSTNGTWFLLKLDKDGAYQWVKNWKGSEGYGVGIDKYKNVYTSGHFSGTRQDFNPGTGPADTFYLSAAGNFDIAVCKFDSNGNFKWASAMGSRGQDNAYDLVVDGEGNSYTTGWCKDSMDFDPGPGVFYTFCQNFAPYVVKLSPDGNLVWAKNLMNGPGSNGGNALHLAEGKGAGVYISGVVRMQAKVGEGADTVNFDYLKGGAFVIKLDTSGKFNWGIQTGGTANGSVAVDLQGNVYSASWFNTLSADFNPGEDSFVVARKGTLDGYIHKMKWCNLSDTITNSVCQSYSFNGETYTESGTYILPNPEGCDSSSKIVLQLDITTLDPIITVKGFVLSTTLTYKTYQWLLNGRAIPGANKATYTVTENGDYRVVVTEGESLTCTDTSDIYKVTNADETGIGMLHKDALTIYPNPAHDVLYISSPAAAQVTIYTLEGKAIKTYRHTSMIPLSGLSAGAYLIKIYDDNKNILKTEKLVKMD